MSNCKCGSQSRIVSNMVQAMDGCGCKDVCTNPIYGEPNELSLFAPLIYDEIGINLCTTITVDPNIATTYPGVANASIKAVNATYTYGQGNVVAAPISGRPNCYSVTLSNIEVTFAINLYNSSCNLIDTIYNTTTFLPAAGTAGADPDTNPPAVTMEIFAPYGISYTSTDGDLSPAINYVGYVVGANSITEGINLFSRAKLLDFNATRSTLTIGLTLVLQSLYFTGYRVETNGKIDTPKGNIMTNEDSDCMRFVAGDLLDLEIKPLDLSCASKSTKMKKDCTPQSENCVATTQE